MSHSLDFSIREQLARYLAHEISLHDFQDWFFPEAWDIDHIADPALASLVYGVKLDLAEFSNGDWTEDELRGLLRSSYLEKQTIALDNQSAANSQRNVYCGTSSTSMVLYPPIAHSELSAGKIFSVGSL